MHEGDRFFYRFGAGTGAAGTGRITDAIQAECLARGIPAGAPPSILIDALRIARNIDIDRQRLIAQSLINSLSLVLAAATGSKGLSAIDAMRHLFSDDELSQIETNRHEAEAMDNSLKVLNRIKAIQAGWDRGRS